MEQSVSNKRFRNLRESELNEFHKDSYLNKVNIQTNNLNQRACNRDYVTSNAKCNSIGNIINSYKATVQGKKDYLNNYVGNHALLATNLECTHSLESYVTKYIENESIKSKSVTKQTNSDKINYEIMNHEYRNKFTYNMYDKTHKLPSDEKRLTSNEKVCHDKMTYCRPVINYYNEQFIYKTMERNARLKRLVRKLAIARQKERETVSWNNFINEIKNKHEFNLEKSKPTDDPEGYITPEIIKDYYNTKFPCVQSRPCKHLLQEFYGINDESLSNTYYRQFNEDDVKRDFRKYLPHERNPYCYPTSSQGRLIIMERERRLKQSLKQWPYNLSDKNVNIRQEIGNRHIDKAESTKIRIGNSIRNFINSHNRATSFDKQASVQADLRSYPDFAINKHQDKAINNIDSDIENQKETSNDFNMLQETYPVPKNNLKKISLVNIDTKLETLIDSINTFIDEIKSNKSKRKTFKDGCWKCKNINKSQNTKVTENDSINKSKTVKIVDKHDTSENTFGVSSLNNHQWSTKLNEIIQGEVQNSKSLQISNTCTNKPCSVQISFEIPTKDCSTEVTKSLSKQNTSDNKESIIEEISTPEYLPLQRMTIAVNTDPLSFLGLLHISTDAFKRLLSYVPNFDYYSYLSLLQFPLSQRKIEPHFVCNICGADFNKPSKLSDHIRDHDLGKTK